MTSPGIPLGWSTLEAPQNTRFAKTYSYYESTEASSAFQKSVRRGKLEAIHWALELYWTGSWHRTNIWNRILVTAVEDIGLACPELILHLIELKKVDSGRVAWGPGHYLALARSVELCVKARKSRLNDLLAHNFSFKAGIHPTIEATTPEQAHQLLVSAIRARALNESLIWAEFLWCTPQKITGKYKRAGWLVWTALEATLEGRARALFIPLRELGMGPNWRWERKTRLLWIHLILVQLYGSILGAEADLTALQEMPVGDLIVVVTKTYQRIELPPVPDYAIDKHTARGAAMGRGLEHFLQVGAVIENSAPEVDRLQQALGL